MRKIANLPYIKEYFLIICYLSESIHESNMSQSDFFNNNKENYKNFFAFILILTCAVETILLIQPEFYEIKIDLSTSSCNHSENLGRKIFLHKCVKEHNTVVYDIRYFFKQNYTLKPDIIGVQLFEHEFKKLCQQCLN